MKIFIGADHRGYEMKGFLKDWMLGLKSEIMDCGAEEFNPDDDYVDYATKVANSVVSCQLSVVSRGIVICGSGVGVCVVANKVKGIRCGLGLNTEQVRATRKDDDINVLALASDFVEVEEAKKMVQVFLETDFFAEERYVRRLEKISELEIQKHTGESG